MTKANRPLLAATDDLTEAADIDLNAALATLTAQRSRSPIIPPSRAADVAALLDLGYPAGGDDLEQLVARINHATGRYPRRNTHPGFFGWVP
jgi:hypothetical protein